MWRMRMGRDQSVSSHAGHRHDHHDHQHAHRGERVWQALLALARLTTTGFMIHEVLSGLLTNSLPLLADAGHMLTDAAAVALALFAIWLARRPATAERSGGFLRAEVLAA